MGLLRKLFPKDILRDVRISFRKVEKELNEHLDSINSNSNEIAYVYELNAKLEEKIDKLKERIEELEMQLGIKNIETHDIQALTAQEKKVFIYLYTVAKATYNDISSKTKISTEMIQEYITNLIAKGVPVQKNFKDGEVFVSIDEEFKNLQAKERIISLR